MHKPALQTITWGAPQHERFDPIFTTAPAAGFKALEIGFRRLSRVPPQVIADLQSEHGLTLAASPFGRNLDDTGQAQQKRAELNQTLDYLTTMGVKSLMYSGLNKPGDHALDRQTHALNEAAKRSADHCVRLLDRNHDWEFWGDRRILDRLLSMADPSLGVGPDPGWPAKTGVDPVALLEEPGEWVCLIPLKDFRDDGPVHEMAGHFFDLVRWLTGAEPESVSAHSHVFGRDKPPLAPIDHDDFDIGSADILTRFTDGYSTLFTSGQR